jgi:predicted RNA binding protein YcfA (HicA-like mRNA interferase family)
VNARKFTRALAEDGFSEDRTAGDHHIYCHADGRIVPVAYTRPNDNFTIGTLHKMIRLAKWTDDDLRRLRLIE